MGRIESRFGALRKQNKRALIVYVTAGDPSLAKTEALLPELERAGVDVIELGIPFSDPLADGPVIQEASGRALKHGATLEKILESTRRARRKVSVPIVYMSYLNPILHMGLERFAKLAAQAGVDGIIIPDLPIEEGAEVKPVFKKHGLDLIYLLAPTTPGKRQEKIARQSSGFVYFVSVTGVTGVRRQLPKETLQSVSVLRKKMTRPVCVGFGVSTPEQASQVAAYSDGVIVGSAVVKALHQHHAMAPKKFAEQYVRPLAKALGKE